MNQVQPDGRFIYGIRPQFDNEIDSYNILRHSGTIWSLICRYRLFPNEALKEKIESTIDYMINQILYDDDGAGYMYEEDDIKEKAVFLLYLVVNPAVQSRGYGTAILRELEKKNPGKQIDLHIEIPKDLCSLEEQAAKRYRFYERAGFRYTGWTTEDDGVKYWIVSNCGTGFDTQAHSAFLIKDRKTGKAIFNHEQA